jgi:hypothetical protein
VLSLFFENLTIFATSLYPVKMLPKSPVLSEGICRGFASIRISFPSVPLISLGAAAFGGPAQSN